MFIMTEKQENDLRQALKDSDERIKELEELEKATDLLLQGYGIKL